MSPGRSWSGMLTVVVLLVGVTCAVAQDWPQWLGPTRNGVPSEFNAPATWPGALTQQWQVAVGPADACPVLVGDRLFVASREGDEEVTHCLNMADGSEIWHSACPAPVVPRPANSHPGPRATPAVAEGRVVTLSVGGTLSCINAETGELVWRKDPFPGQVPRFYTSSSPIIVDGMAIAQLGSEDNGAVIAYDLASGDEKWRWDGEGTQYASPNVVQMGDAKIIVTLTAKSFIGIAAADGKLLWQIAFVPGRREYNASTPVVDGNQVYISGAGRGTRAYNIVAQDGSFAAIEQWKNTDQDVQFNTPLLKDGLLFGLSKNGNLFCLKADTGETAWTDEGALGRGFGEVVDAGTTVLALPESGDLIAYAPTGEGYSEIARYKVSDGGTYAGPVLSGNRIVTRDQEAVTVWQVQ